MMFIYETAKLAPVWTNILKIQVIFVHQTLTEHALFPSGTQFTHIYTIQDDSISLIKRFFGYAYRFWT